MKYIWNHERFTAHGVVSPPVSGKGSRGEGWGREGGYPSQACSWGREGKRREGIPSAIRWYPLPSFPLEQIHTCENITSHRTTYASSKTYLIVVQIWAKIERTTCSIIRGRYRPCIPYETILPVRDPDTPYIMTDKNSESFSMSDEVNRN